MRALNIAATGMQAQQLNVEVISNNLANMNTAGYKRQRAEFQDLLYQNLERSGSASSDAGTVVSSGIQIGLGVRTGSVYRVMEQGNLQQTDSPYDLAIEGRGFFQIQMPDGTTSYTRAGSFQLSPQGQIVTSEGFVVSPGITVPQDATSVSISDSGVVQATLAGQTAPQQIGQLELASFFNEAGLQALGNNKFAETAASGSPTVATPGTGGLGTITQNFLETSNVNAVSEITNLITAQRAYEMNSKVISTADEMLSTTTNIK